MSVTKESIIIDQRVQIRNLTEKVRRFENGEAMKKLKEEYEKKLRQKDREIRKLKKELEECRRLERRNTDMWFSVFEDVEKENEAKLRAVEKDSVKKDRMIGELSEKLEESKQKLSEQRKKAYEAETKFEEEKEKAAALLAKVNKDYTNSSKPSSQSPNHALISNNREKSDKKAGGQPGHAHHGRAFHEPDETVFIDTPAEFLDEGRYKPTGKIMKKQLVQLIMRACTTEYRTPVYYDKKTGKEVHSAFPEGVKDDVNYGGSVKGAAYLLTACCNVSIDNTRMYLGQISGGRIRLSKGMICNLNREFSKKTEEERNRIFLKLLATPVMNADFTFGRMNGKQASVLICADSDTVLYQGKEAKGDKGVEGSPLELYEGTVVSDHEAALRKRGSRHQECLIHVRRYAVGSTENEPERTWNKELIRWIDEAFRYWKEVQEGKEEDKEKVDQLLEAYDKIMETARKEYEDVPPSDYYKEGYNLYKRMSENKQDYVLFLTDPSVPPHNNRSENLARKYKRKSAQVMAFRSQKGVDYFCDGLTIIETLKSKGKNLYDTVSSVFDNLKPRLI